LEKLIKFKRSKSHNLPDKERKYRAIKMHWQEQKDLVKIDKRLTYPAKNHESI